MKTLLVQPPQGSTFGLANVLRIEPLGLECVGAALEATGHEVAIIDMRLDGWSVLERHLGRFGPDAVGVACQFMTDVYPAIQVGRQLSRLAPDVPRFVGGHHASLRPNDLLGPDSPFDALVVGEGEQTTPDLLAALARGADPAQVAGVMTATTRRHGFRPRRWVPNLDLLPLPARHLTARYRSRYHHATWVPSVSIETSRGCPFDCNFCSVWVYYDRVVRRRSPAAIVRDIGSIPDHHVFFTDDIAFLDRPGYEALGTMLAAVGIERNFSAETRADLVVKHRDLFPLWRRVGMRVVFLGIEKIDDAGLAAVRKRTDREQNAAAIRILQAEDIRPMPSFIVDPQWGEGDFDRLEAYVEAMELEEPVFSILTPLPGTELWERSRARVSERNYLLYDVMHAVVPTRLPRERFYERFASLYALTARRQRLGWSAVRTGVEHLLRGHGFAFRRVFTALREMRDPAAYLAVPTDPRPPGAPSVVPA